MRKKFKTGANDIVIFIITYFMLKCFEHENSFITSGPDLALSLCFFMLNSIEHDINTANECLNANISFISRINTPSECFKQENIFSIILVFNFNMSIEISCSVELSIKVL